MESRLPPEGIIRPTSAIPWMSTRPLSDIREITEPNLMNEAAVLVEPPPRPTRLSQDSDAYGSSEPKCPPFPLPRRRSLIRQQRSDGKSVAQPESISAPAAGVDRTIPSRINSRSPVRHLAAKKSTISSDVLRRVPSKTVFRTKLPMIVVENPNVRDSQIKVDLRTTSPLFIGGGTVEGKALVDICRSAAGRRKTVLEISRLQRAYTDTLCGRQPSSYSAVSPLMSSELKRFLQRESPSSCL